MAAAVVAAGTLRVSRPAEREQGNRERQGFQSKKEHPPVAPERAGLSKPMLGAWAPAGDLAGGGMLVVEM